MNFHLQTLVVYVGILGYFHDEKLSRIDCNNNLCKKKERQFKQFFPLFLYNKSPLLLFLILILWRYNLYSEKAKNIYDDKYCKATKI